VNVVLVALTNMTFGGGWDLVPDTGGSYPTPHWTPTNSSPYLYQVIMPVNVKAQFQVVPPTYGGGLTLSGQGPAGLTFSPFTSGVSGGLAYYPATDSSAMLANYVNFWNPMQINWTCSIGGSPAVNVGSSSNKVYVSLMDQTGGPTLYHTVVHLACSHGNANNHDAAVANTWSLFTTGGTGPANVTTWDGKTLYYYRTGCGWANSALNTAQLLSSANTANSWAGHGQCGSFAHLLLDSLSINGVAADWTMAQTTNGDDFIVNDWLFSATPTYTNRAPYQWMFTEVAEPDGSTIGMVPAPSGRVYGDLTKQTTLNGQNTAPPSEEAFSCHFFVKYAGLYYDPSYGVTYTSATDFEAKSVAGYVYSLPVIGLNYKVKKATGLNNISLNP